MHFSLPRFGLTALGLLTAVVAQAQQDLTINYFLQPTAGPYRNVTIQRGGILSLTGPLTVTGRMVIQAGGRLETGGYQCYAVVGPGSFELQAGGTIIICQYEGITRTAAAGAIQVTGARTYAPDATYIYHHRFTPSGGFTGDGLPSVVDNFSMRSSPHNLTNDLTVRKWASIFGFLQLNGHRLTLASDAAGTAHLTNAAVNVPGTGIIPGPGGTVVLQRYLAPGLNPGPGYRHLSVPLTGQTVAALGSGGPGVVVNPAYNTAIAATQVAPFPTVFGYDEGRLANSPATDLAAFDKGWVSPAALTDALPLGRGYTVQARGGQTLEWSGEPVGGNVAVPLTRSGGAAGGWHLVGNPYPGPLDWRLVTVPTGLSGALYVYESTAQYGGRYRSYVNGVGNPIVPLGQAFFVRVSSGAPTLTFTNAARVNYGNFTSGDTTSYTTPVYRGGVANSADPRPLVQLTLGRAGSPLTDDAYVYFETGATAGVDDAYDAVTVQHNSGGAPTLYSQAAGTELSINGLPALTSRTVVPLGLQLSTAGNYELAAAELRNLTGADVYLHDAATGQDINLQQQATYRFSGATGPLTGRFELRLTPARPTAVQAGLLAAGVSIYPNPAHQDFAVLVPAVAGARQVQATLLNGLGQVVRQQTQALPAAGARVVFATAELPAGVYSVRLHAGEEVAVKRVVVE